VAAPTWWSPGPGERARDPDGNPVNGRLWPSGPSGHRRSGIPALRHRTLTLRSERGAQLRQSLIAPRAATRVPRLYRGTSAASRICHSSWMIQAQPPPVVSLDRRYKLEATTKGTPPTGGEGLPSPSMFPRRDAINVVPSCNS